MSEDKVPNISGRKRRKVKIRYRERVRITERPKGYKIRRFWRKNKKNVVAAAILLSLLGITLFMMVRLATHQVEMNKLEKDLNMTIPE